MPTAQDSQWMAQALKLAERGLYTTSPNPRVGCILVNDGHVVGEGWHERAGEPHAEVHALRAAGGKARGATAYVTLEPCSHHGRTPPCAEALIAAGVSRVVAAMQDPNPLVSGQGFERLRAAGIKVEFGLMESVARELNIGFVSRMSRGHPWVRSKIGMSLDGRTALKNGASQWITSADSRHDVQRWRARSCAVLTGIGTVLADDPRLDVREIEIGRHPWRVVLDSQLRMPATAKLLLGGPVLIYTLSQDADKVAALQAAGAEIVCVSDTRDHVDIHAMLRDLAGRGINEVLVEAGATLNGALLKSGAVDELLLYVAPTLLGDAGRGIAALGELQTLAEGITLEWKDYKAVGKDLLLTAKVKKGL